LPNVAPEPRYLSLAQASALTNLSIRTLRRAIDAGRLGAHRLGRLVRIELAELRRWVEADGAAVGSASPRSAHSENERRRARR